MLGGIGLIDHFVPRNPKAGADWTYSVGANAAPPTHDADSGTRCDNKATQNRDWAVVVCAAVILSCASVFLPGAYDEDPGLAAKIFAAAFITCLALFGLAALFLAWRVLMTCLRVDCTRDQEDSGGKRGRILAGSAVFFVAIISFAFVFSADLQTKEDGDATTGTKVLLGIVVTCFAVVVMSVCVCSCQLCCNRDIHATLVDVCCRC